MHKVFITPGIVLSKRSVGEANTLATILTEELGLVRGRAQSARLERSKLRYGLEPLSQGRFSLVRGRHEWRLIGTNDISTGLMGPNASLRTRAGKIAKLLTRLMPGEEHVPGLYGEVSEGLGALARAGGTFQSDSPDTNFAETIECVLVLRILSRLGYLPQNKELAPFIERDFFSLELAGEVASSRSFLVRAINESLKATGL